MASEPFIAYHPVKQAVIDSKYPEDENESISSVGSPSKLKRRKQTSLAIVNVTAGLDGCDDQLLPSSYRALEVELSLHPLLLGQITLVQTLCLSIGSPLWGFLADKGSRKWILALGTFAWGVATIGLAWVSDLWQVILLRAINGFFLGSVGPISQSILADVTETGRGLAFGIVQLSSCIGRLIGGIVTTSVAFLQVGSILAWRLCFMVVGLLSILLSVVIIVFMKEFKRKTKLKTLLNKENEETTLVKDYLEHYSIIFSETLRRPSIVIVTIEGLLGTIPWSALSFNTMFFQYCGMTDVQAASITGALLIGAAGGGLIGGQLGDKMHDWSQSHGRPLIGQLAILGRVPLVILVYVVLPKSPDYFIYYLFIALFVGLTSIAGIAVNRPLLADVVRPDKRGTVFAMIIALEGSCASILGAPLVGILAEMVFGYERSNLPIQEMSIGLRTGNAYALAQALLYQTVIPWSFSFFLYGLLHFTYGQDQAFIKEVMKKEYDNLEDSSDDD